MSLTRTEKKREDTAAEVVGSNPTRSTVCPVSNQGHLLVRLQGLENYNATNKGNKSSVRLLEVRLYSITLACFLKNFAWTI